jgi:hypothetical protein
MLLSSTAPKRCSSDGADPWAYRLRLDPDLVWRPLSSYLMKDRFDQKFSLLHQKAGGGKGKKGIGVPMSSGLYWWTHFCMSSKLSCSRSDRKSWFLCKISKLSRLHCEIRVPKNIPSDQSPISISNGLLERQDGLLGVSDWNHSDNWGRKLVLHDSF